MSQESLELQVKPVLPLTGHLMILVEEQVSVTGYCFTSFEIAVPKFPSYVSFAVFQLERTREGRLHWQGYLECDRPRRYKELQLFLPKAHLEERRGTRQQAIAYCKKQDTRAIDMVGFCGPFTYSVDENKIL